MSFIVEDGSGKVDSNSYVTVAFANAYFLERNVSTWDNLDDDIKKASLILATDYIELRFESKFKGQKFNKSQSLSFPMVSLNDTATAIDTFIYPTLEPVLDPLTGLPLVDPITGETVMVDITIPSGVEIPLKLKRATCEYALRAATDSLVKDVLSDSITSERVKIGQIEKETNYTSNSKRPDMFSSFPTADLLIKPYLKHTVSGVLRA